MCIRDSIRPTKYYLDDTDKTGGPDGTWKRTYSLDEDGNRVLDPYYPDVYKRQGLDYVSCSPYRVPVARLAAAQAAIKQR